MAEKKHTSMATSAAAELFALRLREGMKRRGLKQADLIRMAAQHGAKLGKSQVSQYVSGKTMPRPDVAALLSTLLNVPDAWLIGSDDDPNWAGEPAPAESAPEGQDAPVTAATLDILSSSIEPSVRFSATSSERTTPMAQRKFTKSSKLDNVLYDVRGPVVDEAARLESEGAHILKLNIGNPAPFGFRTPVEVIQDMREQLPECEGYSDSRGLFSARKAIMQYAQLKGLPNVSMDGIYTGNGVSELINLCMQALLDTATRSSSLRPTIRFGPPARRSPAARPCTTAATSRPIGTRTWPTWRPRSLRAPRRSSSSTPTTPRAPSTRRTCSRASWRLPAVTSS